MYEISYDMIMDHAIGDIILKGKEVVGRQISG